jgi:hypothetical protein
VLVTTRIVARGHRRHAAVPVAALGESRMISCVDGHRTAERRSLAYHRVIAERIVDDPSVIAVARERVRSWQGVHRRYVAAWGAIIARPVAEVAALLVEDSERMTMLRQVSPFAGVLDPRTRWQIWRSVA